MWWMPWRSQAKKDVAACEKLRGAGKRAMIRRYPNGETRPTVKRLLRARRMSARPKPSENKRAWTAFARAKDERAPKAIQRTSEHGKRRTLNCGSLLSEYIGQVERTR